MTATAIPAFLLCVATIVLLQAATCVCLVVTLPRRLVGTSSPSQDRSWPGNDQQSRYSSRQSQSKVAGTTSTIIRKATKDDVSAIARLLAVASIGHDERSSNGMTMNWNEKMQLLHAEATYRKQLTQRIDALDAGAKAANKARIALINAGMIEDECSIDTMSNVLEHPEGVGLMWSDDAFRRKIERAIDVETERHGWHGHNFAVPPEESSLLQHAMFTCLDRQSGEIAGFCEVATLPLPDEADAYGMRHMPCIANLAVSPQYRRRGIAKALLRASKRYVKSYWPCDDIGLYVEKENVAATLLYSQEGFVFNGVCSERPTRLYLQKSLAVT